MKPSGYILTGGKSQRFGNSDKALAQLNGQTLVERAASLIGKHCSSVTLVASAEEQYAHLAYPIIGDRLPDLGPIGGIDAALNDVGLEGWAFICPCDLSYVGQSWLPTLLQNTQPDADAVVFKGERYEPLFTLYHGRIAPRVQEHIQSKTLAPHHLFPKIKSRVLPLPDDWPKEPSFNTLESLEAFKD